MNLDNLKLAEDSEAFMIDSRQDNHDALLAMVKQARHSLEIYSHNLDGSLYDTSEFVSAIKQLSLNGNLSKVRVLLRDLDHITRHGHRVVELGRRLPSFLEIRQVNSDFEHIISCYSIVDHRGIIFRNDALRYEAKVNFNDPLLSRDCLQQFNEIWNQSDPSQEMRNLHI